MVTCQRGGAVMRVEDLRVDQTKTPILDLCELQDKTRQTHVCALYCVTVTLDSAVIPGRQLLVGNVDFAGAGWFSSL